MILKAIEMQGFKSFPEKTTLTFGPGITAVVGPNGSGKSNISDAVRWVLGEQSSKSLRGSKMEDVIFDGTKVRKAHGFASVTLRLDNSDRSIASVDSDEVAVTRRFFRSGESEYKINGNTVRLRDIHELFMDTGLGRDGYSMVSQGKIAEMISGKGKECREMLEEACGISAYRYRRSDSIRKLAQAEDNLVRLRDIAAELEGRIGPLKTQSEKAQKFLVFSGEKRELEIGLWLYNIDKLKADIRKQEDSISIAAAHYEQVQKQLAEIEAQMESTYEKAQNLTVQIEEVRGSAASFEESAAANDSRSAVFENSIEHNEQTIARILGDKSNTEQSRKQLEKEIEGEKSLISQIKAIAEKKREELEKVKKELEERSSEGNSLDEMSAALSSKIAEHTQKLADCRVTSSTARSSADELRSRLESLGKLAAERKESLFGLEKEKKKALAALEKCNEEVVVLSNTAEGLSLRCKTRLEKADRLKKDLDNKLFEVQHLASKKKMLEDLEKNMDGYLGSVKAVIKEGERGTLSGILGTVSKLISIKSEYTVAIETALGNAVQNIVCETETDAKNAINYLKRTGSGRATFQPVSTVRAKSFDETGLEKTEGFIKMANELVENDSRFDEIIRSLLGRIAVCEDIDSALSLARKFSYRFKIVTLDGQVVNAGGSMTGGSQSRSAGILSRSSEIERLSKKHGELLHESEEMQRTYDEVCVSLSKAQAELDGAKGELLSKQEDKIRLEGEKKLWEEQYSSALVSFEALEKESSSSAERLASLEETRKKSEHEIEKIAKAIEENEEKLSSLGQKKDELSARREKTGAEISKLSLDLHDADKDLAARTQAMNLLIARLVSHEDKDKQLEEEIEEIKAKNEELRNEIALLKKGAAEYREKAAKARDSIVALQKERAEKEEKSGSLRVFEREKASERETVSGEKARLEERRETMLQELDQTVTKLYDEYQLTLREATAQSEKTDDPQGARRRLAELKNKIRALGSVNVGAIEEYKEVNERYQFLSSQLSDVERSKQELSKLITELTGKMSDRFRERFALINQYFGETFRELFAGGKAELALLDPTDVLESEIDIRLQPPGKNVKRLDALSGGEKGLSAIALLFAILKVNPAPFCIFDEVEAALDDANVVRYAQYVRRMTKNTQFILITHRRGTMEEADMLYGITMQEQGVSKLLELKTAELAGKLDNHG